MEGFNFFKRKPETEEEAHVVIDPTTGAVINSADTLEERKAKLRQAAEDMREAA
jgi:hypothetical protein